MFTIIKKEEEKLVPGTLEDFHKKHTVWLDVIDPTEKEILKISEATGIDVKHLQEHLRDERPHLDDLGTYSIVVLDAPGLIGKEIVTHHIACLISSNNNIITIRNHAIDAIDRINDILKKGKIKAMESRTKFLYVLIDEINRDYFRMLNHIEDKVEEIEEKVFKKPDRSHALIIFKLKKVLIYFHKSLIADREVIIGIEKEYLSEIERKDIRKFRDLYNDCVQLIDMEETYRDILTGVLDIYLSSTSNNLNQVMKTLTIITTFIMAPALIAGIYGMNFSILPELGWRYGYAFALFLMVFIDVGFFVYFKRKGWV